MRWAGTAMFVNTAVKLKLSLTYFRQQLGIKIFPVHRFYTFALFFEKTALPEKTLASRGKVVGCTLTCFGGV